MATRKKRYFDTQAGIMGCFSYNPDGSNSAGISTDAGTIYT
ncbi:MAG: hypothetical protein V7K43_26095 [Nostoc sp.]